MAENAREGEASGAVIGFVRAPREGVYLVTGFFYDGLMNRRPKVFQVNPLREHADALPENTEELQLEPGGPIKATLLRLWLRRLSHTLDEDRPAMVSGRTTFEAYQFRPLLKYLASSRQRLLIADEAGLGKTVEAGYVLAEEMQRHRLHRVLIICPSHLKLKWRWEMWWRFGIQFRIVSARRLLSELDCGTGSFQLIASFDVMRKGTQEFHRILTSMASDLDMLIIDEVHNLIGRTGETLRRRLGMMLSLRSRRVLALSATPVQIDAEDLTKVLAIVDPTVFVPGGSSPIMALHSLFVEAQGLLSGTIPVSRLPRLLERLTDITSTPAPDHPPEESWHKDVADLTSNLRDLGSRRLSVDELDRLRERAAALTPLAPWMTRTRRREVGQERHRNILSRRFAPSEEIFEVGQGPDRVKVSETLLYERIDQLFLNHFYFCHRCQLSSSILGTATLLEHGARGFNFWVDGKRILTADEVEAGLGDTETSKRLEPRLNPESRQLCTELWRQSRLISIDTKWDELVSTLKSLRKEGRVRKAVVFTQWRPTLEYLRSKSQELADTRSFFVSGSDSQWGRHRTVELFTAHSGFAVLFASDVLAEGLDLVAADCVVNYDLPFNPQRLEQRIGRVDRINQESTEISVVNLLMKGSLDERVHDLLLERIEAFTLSVGSVSDTLWESLAEKGNIDAGEVTRIRREIRDRERLDAAMLFIVGGTLDEAAKRLDSEERFVTPSALREVFYHFFATLLGSGHVARLGRASVVLNSTNSEIVADVLGGLCGPQVANEVEQEVAQALHEGLPLTFHAKEQGYFLPPGHPLVQSVCQVMERTVSARMEETVLVLRGASGLGFRALVIEELLFQGRGGSNRTWIIRGLSEDGLRVVDFTPTSVLRILSEMNATEAGPRQGQSAPKELEDSVREYANMWFEDRESLDKNSTIYALQGELARLLRFDEITGRRNPLTPGQTEGVSLMNRIAAIRRNLDELDDPLTSRHETGRRASRLVTLVVEGRS